MIRRKEIFFNEYSNYLKENEDPNRDPWKSLPFILMADQIYIIFEASKITLSIKNGLI